MTENAVLQDRIVDLQNTPSTKALLEQFPSSTKPFTALTAIARFLMNKEDTKQFFVIFDAIDGGQNERNFQRYGRTEAGRRMIDEGVDFTIILKDRDYLRAMPPGSLGAAYFDFTERENINVEGLESAEQEAGGRMLHVEPARRRFIGSGIALHDVWHVITGYGRDALGEACLLTFTHEQMQTKGVGFVAQTFAIREQMILKNVPVMKCMKEARTIGKAAAWFPTVDWRKFFALPLEETRRLLNVTEPTLYQKFAAQVAVIDRERRERLASKSSNEDNNSSQGSNHDLAA